jgi:ankyrin repeat protein
METDDNDNDTNIWMACSDGNIECVKSLIKSGVSINAQDENGYSPIHAAVSYGHADLIEFLLDNGANISLRDVDGDTPLLMCEEPDIFELLLRRGANPLDTNNEGECLLEKAIEDENEILIGYLISNQHMSSEQAQELMSKRQKSLQQNEHEDDEDDDEEYLLPDDVAEEEEMIGADNTDK